MQNEKVDQEVQKLFELSFDFAVKLSQESDRGSILVGCSKVEEYLSNLVTCVFPKQTKSYVNRLKKYTGPLSSFSAQIEMSYAFRIINERMYNSLNALRKVRNKAAHSSDTFSIKDIAEDLDCIYRLEDDHAEWIHNLTKRNMMNWKLMNLKKSFKNEGLDEKVDPEELWNKKIKEKETIESLDTQLISWKMYYGLALLCMYLKGLAMQVRDYSGAGTWIKFIIDKE